MLWVLIAVLAVCGTVVIWLVSHRWRLGRLGNADLEAMSRDVIEEAGPAKTICFQGINNQPAVLISSVVSGPEKGIYLTLMGERLSQTQIESLREAMSSRSISFLQERIGLRQGQPVAEFQIGDCRSLDFSPGVAVRIALEAVGLTERDWFVRTRHSLSANAHAS